jgi:rsbT co-antagonist protein RsbR
MSHDGGRWSEDDLALLRALGGRLSQLIHGEDADVPDLQRRDELGILANMVGRLARDLRVVRRNDRAARDELEARVAELQAAYETQEKLLATIREVGSPLLELFDGLLLLPIVGVLDAARVSHVLTGALRPIAQRRPKVLVIHLTGADAISPDVAALLVRFAQSARRHGARAVVLSGVPVTAPRSTIDLSAMAPCADLPEAIATAFDLLGYRIAR